MKTIQKKHNLALVLLLIFLTGTAFLPVSRTADRAVNPDRKIQIALLLDTSNSMDGLIDQAKAQLWKIVNDLAKAKCEGESPSISIALYEYGNDRLNGREGYIRMVLPMTSDLDEVSAKLFSLSTNGGSEYCGHVIQTSLNQLDWARTNKDLQMIFIAGNESFTQGGVNYKEACASAKNKNIVVNTIFCGAYQQGIGVQWKDGADLTGGNYMSIEQDKRSVFVPSPYDDKINQLNDALNKTYIAYGRMGSSKKEMQRMQDDNASSYGQANKVNRAVSKSSHVYKNKSWDLVDASEDASFKVEEVEEAALPKEMKGMNNKEKKAYVAKMSAKRASIQKEIQKLGKQRAQFLAEQKQESGQENMLDEAMIKAIRKQAALKDFVFED